MTNHPLTYGYFEDGGEQNVHTSGEDMISILSNLLISGEGGFFENEGVEEEFINNLLGAGNYLGVYDQLKEQMTDPYSPRAYLNYMAFNEDMEIVSSQSGAIQVNGEPGAWHQMGLPQELTISQNGYFLLYISNEQYMDVHFDNVYLKHRRGTQLEEMHYYPHGLLIKPKSTSGVNPENKYQYQGKIYQDELSLNLYDFHARQYDPQIGRFWSVDPVLQFASSYIGMGNNPASLIDPTGTEASTIGGDGEKKVEEKEEPEHAVPLKEQPASLPWWFDFLLMVQMDAAPGGNIDGSGQGGGGGNFWTTKGSNTPSVFTLSEPPPVKGARNNTQQSVGQPATWESAIPFWGSGRSAVDHFQNGNYWRGTGHTVLAITDLFLAKSIVTGAGKVIASSAAKTGMKAIEAGSYTFTKTAAKHLSSRPYMNSPSTITNIMKSGKGVPDATFKGGVNYKVPGTFNGSQGVWELGINPQTNTIYHFLFKSVK